MLIAVQQNNKINAVMVDNRQACEMIARAIGRVLDGEQFNILSEVILQKSSMLNVFITQRFLIIKNKNLRKQS